MALCLILGIILLYNCPAQSASYIKKKDSALKVISPFELIAAHQNKDVVIEYEDDDIVIFEPNVQQAPVHLLIVPKKRIYTLNETGYAHENLLGKMILKAKEMAKKKGIDETGYRLTINTNENAGQSVFHIHLHLLGGIKLGPMMDQRFRNEAAKLKEQKEIKMPLAEKYIIDFKDSTNFQGAVLIARGDSIIHHAAYGLFDVKNKVPHTTNSQFLIGSLTKSFVAIAIMQLVEKRLIDLNAPLQQYLPGLKPELARGLTVHHLLKHQSGLAVYIDDLTAIEIMDITASELLDIINKSKKSFSPGEKHEYSNINYNLLAMIIENVSGQPYPSYLQENIFKPAGMTASGVERLSNIPSNRAVGYRTINNIFRPVQNVVSYALGTGDIYSTTIDLYNWGIALHSGKLINAESRAKLFDGGTKDWGYYGYGFRIQQYQRNNSEQIPGTLIRHGGTMNGYISNYHYYKEDNLTIILLSNYRNIPIRNLSYHLKEIVLGVAAGKRKNVWAE